MVVGRDAEGKMSGRAADLERLSREKLVLPGRIELSTFPLPMEWLGF
jgi:hypothetical protein